MADVNDPRREVVSKVLEQITRLDKTATDLLAFGKPGTPEFTFVDINELLKKTLFFVAQHPEARNVHQVQEQIYYVLEGEGLLTLDAA